jgi:hypothetical protein
MTRASSSVRTSREIDSSTEIVGAWSSRFDAHRNLRQPLSRKTSRRAQPKQEFETRAGVRVLDLTGDVELERMLVALSGTRGLDDTRAALVGSSRTAMHPRVTSTRAREASGWVPSA